MKLMIDISDSIYEVLIADWKNAGWLFGEELKAIHKGTPVPDNSTNGDVLKALFPKKEWLKVMAVCERDKDIKGWWNALYKRGDTE